MILLDVFIGFLIMLGVFALAANLSVGKESPWYILWCKIRDKFLTFQKWFMK